MIVSLTGKCDGVDIVFKHLKDNQWVCDVPTDFIDGVYVIELFAMNDAGSTTYYTGVFYVCDGKYVSVKINDDCFICTFLADNVDVAIFQDWLRVEFTDCLTVKFIDAVRKGGDVVLNFCLGEKKYIPVSVRSTKKQAIVITDASYKIVDDCGNLIASGQCEINNDESMLLIFYEPKAKGTYNLEVSYTIPPETRIARCDLNVN